MSTQIPTSARVLLDGRWLGIGGAGRVTDLLLSGLRNIRPPGAWTLWGGPEMADRLWPGARLASAVGSPLRFAGQRGRRRLPESDCVLFLHQIRPLVRNTSIVFFHDTIPIRFAPNRWTRRARLAYMKSSAAMATRILTCSKYSAGCIERDLGIPSSRIHIVDYPVDPAFTERVRGLRETVPVTDTVLYVGRFAAHKNLDRLVRAFPRTSFARAGGRLICVGGTSQEVAGLRRLLTGPSPVTLIEECTQTYLETLYAQARLLVLPSLEEGFGLPVLEAQSIGLPVSVADAGSLPELVPDSRLRFDPFREEAIAVGIDRSLDISGVESPALPHRPSTAEFAEDVCRHIAQTLS